MYKAADMNLFQMTTFCYHSLVYFILYVVYRVVKTQWLNG